MPLPSVTPAQYRALEQLAEGIAFGVRSMLRDLGQQVLDAKRGEGS
jgi:hypothetical protein